VFHGKGSSDDSRFIERALTNIREFMVDDGQEFIFRRFIVPASGTIRFGKALNRSVTGSMNEMVAHAKYWLSEVGMSPGDAGTKLNEMPMSAIGDEEADSYGIPREVFKKLADRCNFTLPDA
jgi:hypothetical protein